MPGINPALLRWARETAALLDNDEKPGAVFVGSCGFDAGAMLNALIEPLGML